MKILFLDTYYDAAWRSLVQGTDEQTRGSYAGLLSGLLAQGFGTADFYSRGLSRLGWNALDTVVNCLPLQEAWAREHGLAAHAPWWPPARRKWCLAVALEQVRAARPDVLYVHDVYFPSQRWLAAIRNDVRCIVGQMGYALDKRLDISHYDLILSSIPTVVEEVRSRGGDARYFRLAFETTMLERIGPQRRETAASFVGTLSAPHGVHGKGTALLEYLACRVPLSVWGQGADALESSSPIRGVFRGPAWGRRAYEILASSKIVVNRHASWAGPDANNMRLFEATGMGALLLTDEKRNLPAIFERGTEVVAYRSKYECAELVQYYLQNESERSGIAERGQARTLRDHTYTVRAGELNEILGGLVHSASPHARRQTFSTGDHDDLGAMSFVSSVTTVAARVVGDGAIKDTGRHLVRWIRRRAARLRKKLASRQLLPSDGWRNSAIPLRQRELVDVQLINFYQGRPVPPFEVLIKALSRVNASNILEVGCASAYNFEVIQHAHHRGVSYAGTDLSLSLLAEGRREYSNLPLFCADATRLPLGNGSYETVLSGCVLLHVPDWKAAVAESNRVAAHAVVFHRTPVLDSGPSTEFEKLAYGIPVREWAFSVSEFESALAANGLIIVDRLEVGIHRIPSVRIPVRDVTYVCVKERAI
jgi:SAM-dependent methyltransferase